ncbi:hypothetical protein [Ovoidimarina sediminis]|uniref:hypothetical protein n=1 Tax=Ovoidimarina sediminis TaxID=3079856 RepID=UPI002911C7E4|nr:hypothetical protein [Rhodophyticola sp. MJ-SS7]MDU8945879.1 hypothetical protein [Rhodophyticola sp. MJ-SS7]
MDFFNDLGDAGADAPRFLRRPLAILGILIGAAVGAYLGYGASGILGALGGFFTGAFVGWGLSMLLAGVVFFVVIFALVLVVSLGWTWLTGGG